MQQLLDVTAEFHWLG